MNKIIKELVLQGVGILQRDHGGKIVYYHDIFEATKYTSMGTPVSVFIGHLEAIKAVGYQFVDHVPSGDYEVQLCFDDGFRGVWDCREYFFRRNLHPTIYIAMDLIGRDGYMGWPEILELQKMGFRFQSHTWSHGILCNMDDATLKHEICESKEALSEKLGNAVTQLCFPCGAFSSKVLDVAWSAGYEDLVSSIPGSTNYHWRNLPFDSSQILPRTLIQAYTVSQLRAIMNGALLPFYKRYVRQHFRG